MDELGNDQSKQVFMFSKELKVVPLVSIGEFSATPVVMRLTQSDGLAEYRIGRSILKGESSEIFIVWSENLLPSLSTDSPGLSGMKQLLKRAAFVPPEEAGDAPSLRRALKFQYFGPSWDNAAASVSEEFTDPPGGSDVHIVCDFKLFVSGKYSDYILLFYWIPLQKRLACFACYASESPCTFPPMITKTRSSEDCSTQTNNFAAFTGCYRGVMHVGMGIPGKLPREIIDGKVCYSQVLPLKNEDFRLKEFRKTTIGLRMSNPNPWQAAQISPPAM